MMSTTMAYAECLMCCATCSTSNDTEAEAWADKHEDSTGHAVKVHYMGERT
jgi:hypothetical protein